MQELLILLAGLLAGALLQAMTSWLTERRMARRADSVWLRDKQWEAYSDYTSAVADAKTIIRDLSGRWRAAEDDGAWAQAEEELDRLIPAVEPAIQRVQELALVAALPTRPDRLPQLQSLNDDFVEAVLEVRKTLVDDRGERREAEYQAWGNRVTFLTHEIRRFAARELGYRTDAPRDPPARPTRDADTTPET